MSSDSGAGSSRNPNLPWQSSINPESDGESEDEFSHEHNSIDDEVSSPEDGSDTTHNMISTDHKSDLNEVLALLLFDQFAYKD